MRPSLQRLKNLLAAPLSPAESVPAAQSLVVGDAYAPLQGHVQQALRDAPAVRAVRLNGLVNDDSSRAAFTQGLRDVARWAPQLQKLHVDPFYWRRAPVYRTADNRSRGVPSAPRWQWPHAYPCPPEAPQALRGLRALRTVHLAEEMTALVAYLPPGVDSLKVELGSLSQLSPRPPLRLSGVRALEVMTPCAQLPEAARIIEAAPRLERLHLSLRDASLSDETPVGEPALDIVWPQTLQSLTLQLTEVPALQRDGASGELRNRFLGALWQGLPPLQALTLDVRGLGASVEALRRDLGAWRGREALRQLTLQGASVTQDDMQALRRLLPRQAVITVS